MKNARLRKRDRGYALVLTAAGMVCLIGFVGLSADIGLLLRDKVNLQKVADAAAIAAASQLPNDSSCTGACVNAAQDSAAQNGVSNGVNGTVTATLGTTYHPSSVKVYVSQTYNTAVMSLFGYRTVSVGASAVAGITQGNGCIIALDLTPFKSQGMTMNGTGDIDAPNCGIYDNSGLTMNGSSGSITAKFIAVTGAFSGNGQTSPTPITGTVPVPDPLAYWTAPTPSGACLTNPNLTKGSGTVNPGCYKGLTVGSGVTMKPGLYIVQGALNVNNVTATGVTFYIDGANNGAFGSVDGSTLIAPTLASSGTCTSTAGCNGILIWDTESTGKSQQGVSFGPSSATLDGILYFPNASLKFHGDNTTTLNADVIAQSYAFDGTVNINNYILSSGQSPLFLTPTILE